MVIEVVSNQAPLAAPAAEPKPVETPSEPVPKGAALKEPAEKDAAGTEEEKPETDAEGDEPEATADGQPKRKSGSQRQKERAERAEAEVERLRKLVEGVALKGAGAETPKPDADAPKAEQAGKPDPEKFETHAEYVEALTDWKLDVREKARDAAAQKAQIEAAQAKRWSTYSEREKAFKAEVGDYDDVIAGVEDIVFSPAALDAISNSEVGPQISYELAKNRAEAERIAKLPPGAAYMAIGRLEAKIESAKSSEAKPEPKKQTNAPKPITPVGGKGGPTEKKTLEEAAKTSQAEYEAIRLEQIRQRRGA